MWLLNVHTLELEEFVTENCKPYAILSHRWQKDEVLFRDMRDLESAKCKEGYHKIAKMCELAANTGLSYVWIDTCCINKESSAELSEAVNSMFEWYKGAKVCYAYLFDTYTAHLDTDEFRRSEWFKRGWTLQELIVPEEVLFLNNRWDYLGRKTALVPLLESITGICQDALLGFGLHPPWIIEDRYSIAERMSWAAGRKTERREDQAYCLFGIFHVNMPLLYGEGHQAFKRLQAEIIRQSYDRSIFLWQRPESGFSGFLAESTMSFSKIPQSVRGAKGGGPSYALTNRGMNIKLWLRPWTPQIYIAFLGNRKLNTWDWYPLVLCRFGDSEHCYWRRMHNSAFDTVFWRCHRRWRGWRHLLWDAPIKLREVTIQDHDHQENADYSLQKHNEIVKRRYGFNIQLTNSVKKFITTITSSRPSTALPNQGIRMCYQLHDTYRKPFNDQEFSAHLEPGEYGVVLMLETSHILSSLHRIALGFDFEGVPFFLATKRRSKQQFFDDFEIDVSNYWNKKPTEFIEHVFDRRSVPINKLIDDGNAYRVSSPEIEEWLETTRRTDPWKGLEWTCPETDPREPSYSSDPILPANRHGIWALKGYTWRAILRLATSFEYEPVQFLRVEFSYSASRLNSPCAVELQFCDYEKQEIELSKE